MVRKTDHGSTFLTMLNITYSMGVLLYGLDNSVGIRTQYSTGAQFQHIETRPRKCAIDTCRAHQFALQSLHRLPHGD